MSAVRVRVSTSAVRVRVRVSACAHAYILRGLVHVHEVMYVHVRVGVAHAYSEVGSLYERRFVSASHSYV